MKRKNDHGESFHELGEVGHQLLVHGEGALGDGLEVGGQELGEVLRAELVLPHRLHDLVHHVHKQIFHLLVVVQRLT